MKLHRFNEKFSVLKLSLIGAVTGGLKIVQIILGIFSLGSFLSIPVAIMYIVLALATGSKVASEVMESKNKKRYEEEEKTSKTYDFQIEKLEGDLEKCVSDIKRIAEKKSVVDSGINEIDEYLRKLDVDFEKMRDKNLNNDIQSVEEVVNGPKV